MYEPSLGLCAVHIRAQIQNPLQVFLDLVLVSVVLDVIALKSEVPALPLRQEVSRLSVEMERISRLG